MSHTTEVVKYEKLSNGQFAVTIRCCGNASTDWSHTMAAEVAADPERRAASLAEAKQSCAALHQHALDAEAGLIQEMGKITEHV
jgi:hypothetical protein